MIYVIARDFEGFKRGRGFVFFSFFFSFRTLTALFGIVLGKRRAKESEPVVNG